MIISLIFNGLANTIEQKLFTKYQNRIHSLEMAGYEGIFGIIIMGLLIILFFYLPC